MKKRTAFIDNGIYHVFNRGNGYEPIFRNFGNYDYFMKKYHEYMTPHWETLAWCLMPNHFHFLVRVKPHDDPYHLTTDLCIKAYADFCCGYVLAYNNQHQRQGSLFMRSFKRKPVEDEEYMRKLICYIHNNPVKDGYVKTGQEWFHSSYHELYDMTENEAETNEIIMRFGSKNNFLHAHVAELGPGSIDLKAEKVIGQRKFDDLVYHRMKPRDPMSFKEIDWFRDAS